MKRRSWQQRNIRLRPHLFEWIAWSNFLIFQLFIAPRQPFAGSARSMAFTLLNVGITFILQLALGIGIRVAWALRRGPRRYFVIIRSAGWWILSIRIGIATVLVVYVYSWLKLLVPILNPVSYDAALWSLDRQIFFGLSPDILALNLFPPLVLHAIDYLYANLFLAILFVSGAIFMTIPSARLRIAYSNGIAFLWIAGAWLYLLIPSLGPCYRFQDVWDGVRQFMPRTEALQYHLMHNYEMVLHARRRPELLQNADLLLGIAAFPSLHVALTVFVALWARRIARLLAPLLLASAIIIFIGSLVTGWHYLIDSLAGVALAGGAFAISIVSARARAHRATATPKLTPRSQ